MNYSYAKYVGIVDVVIIIVAIICMIIGAKEGFLQKGIKIANWVFGVFFAFLFCVKFANDVLYGWFGENIKNTIYNNVLSNEALQGITTKEEAVNVLQSLGIPNFIGEVIMQNVDTAEMVSGIASSVSTLATSALLIVISFLFLWIGTSILCFILQLLVKVLRTSKLIRILDGILGILLYLLLFYLFIQVVFFVVILIYRNAHLEGFNNFVSNDILGVNASFRISKYFFETNFLANLFALLF